MLAAVMVGVWSVPAPAHKAGKDARLSKIGPAPEFTLTTQDARRLRLGDLRGKVVAVTFVYATCTDTCPMLTAKMAALQQRLGKDFDRRSSSSPSPSIPNATRHRR